MTALLLFMTHDILAGEIYSAEYNTNDVYSFEARMMENHLISAEYPNSSFSQDFIWGLGYDPAMDILYGLYGTNGQLLIQKSPHGSFWGYAGPTRGGLNSLSVGDDGSVFGAGYSVWSLYPGPIVDYGMSFNGLTAASDYYQEGGYHVIVNGYVVSGFLPHLGLWEIAELRPDQTSPPDSAGYDSDLRIFWLGSNTVVNSNGFAHDWVTGFDPDTWTVVAKVLLLSSFNLAGSRDNIPFQLPTLLVTGECPGTMYVTLADGTPGDEAVFMSGVVERSRTVRGGPCAGATAGLANPREQARLTVGSNGLASTSFTAAPEHCGALKIQAMDTATCTLTEVRTVETAVVPFDRPPLWY